MVFKIILFILLIFVGFIFYRMLKCYYLSYNIKIIGSKMSNILIVEDKFINYFQDYINSVFKNDYTLILYNKRLINFKQLKKILNKYPKSKKFFIYKIPSNLNLSDFKKVYFINTEQLTRKSCLEYCIKISKSVKLIDYSYENINIINKYKIQSLYLPYIKNSLEIYNFPKIYDVAIIGLDLKKNKCNRRNKIYYLLKSKGININNIVGFGYENRDKFLFQHKILINIHYDVNYKIYEEIRCTRCTLNNMIVITERSQNLKKYKYYKNIIETDYHNIVDLTIKVLKNYDIWKKKYLG